MPAGFQAFGSAAGYVGAQPWTPLRIPGLALWLDLDVGVTLNSGKVAEVDDQSAEGDAAHNLAQATPGNRPGYTLHNASYGNHATADFSNASATYLTSGTWASPLSQPWSEFIVGHCAAGASSRVAIDDLAAQRTLARTAAGPLQIYAGSVLTSGAAGPGAPSIFGADFDGASSKIYCNAKTAQVTGPAGSGGRTGITLGGLFNHSAGFFWEGPIACVVIYRGVLSAGDRGALLDWMSARYGMAVGA